MEIRIAKERYLRALSYSRSTLAPDHIQMQCFAVRGGEAEIHVDTNPEVCNNWLLLITKSSFLSGLHEDTKTNVQKRFRATTARRGSKSTQMP